MDPKLRLLQQLYGEAADGGDADERQLRRLLAEDPDLAAERDALARTRFVLDHRRPERPDASVVDAVVAAAAAAHGRPPGEPPRGGARRDRPPARPAGRGQRFRMIGVLCTLVLLAGVGVWQLAPRPVAAPAAAPVPADESRVADDRTRAFDAPASEALAIGEEAAPAAPSAPAPSLTAGPAAAPLLAGDAAPAGEVTLAGDAVAVRDGALAWDDAEEVLRLRRRIELLEARSALEAWDESVTPLEQMPAAPAAARGLRQAGGHR